MCELPRLATSTVKVIGGDGIVTEISEAPEKKALAESDRVLPVA
jgi:hypothetical protein